MPEAVELRRTIPVVEKLAAHGVVVSIATQKAAEFACYDHRGEKVVDFIK